jgi:DNA-directed RNA polymerase subunit RPC12/RpoP
MIDGATVDGVVWLFRQLRCLRCRHTWQPRVTHDPKRCPQCGSPYWMKPRQKESHV